MKTFGKLLAISIINPSFIGALSETTSNQYLTGLLMAFLMTLLQAFVIYILVTFHNGQSRKALLWKTTLIFYGTTFLQANIEAVLFLKYMQNTMSDTQINEMLIMGVVSSLIVAPVGVYLFWKEKPDGPRFSFPVKNNLLRGTGVAFLYMVIYTAFGALVFKPLAGDHFQAYYGDLQIPDWLLPFQILRGALWAWLIWGTMHIVSGTRRQVVWYITAVMAIPITSLLLPINEVMPGPIRTAHFVEVGGSMLVFGFLAGRIFTRPLNKIKQ